jgi:phenylalanyl-tRNA synthetase alpha chain
MAIAKLNLKSITKEAEKEIKNSKNLKSLDFIFKKYLGKKSEVSRALRLFKDLSGRERKKLGKEINIFKKTFRKEIEKKTEKIKKENGKVSGKKDWFDITIPGKKIESGHLHPLTMTRRRIEEIFQKMGFEIAQGSEIETAWYNFDALNIPADHPARDAWNTLWLKEKDKNGEQFLLRTHTSPMQIHYMETHNPPLRLIVPGKTFRREATDASHNFQFYQVEGLMVDKNVSVPHLKAVISNFFRLFFNKKVKVRLRPDFFPFTEPSFEISMSCLACEGKGCKVCKNTGWLEMGGAGMVHPNVFKACKLDSKKWQGWAFGFGWDRLAMMKYKIKEIRLFNAGNLRFLKQF